MKNKYDKLESIILNYENDKINIEEALSLINKITSKEVKQDDIVEYWAYTTLKDLIQTLLIEPILDWKYIEDDKAIHMIKEILKNISNSIILERNSEALEKRYKKPSGTIIELIFSKGLDNSEKILEKLKENSIIHL